MTSKTEKREKKSRREKDEERKRWYWSRINKIVDFVRKRGVASAHEISIETGIPEYFIYKVADTIEENFKDITYDVDGNFYSLTKKKGKGR